MSLFFSFPRRSLRPLWLTLVLWLFLTACNQATTPTPSAVSQRPTFPAVVTFTSSAVPSPTATPTPSATPDRVATALARPTRTPRPTFTATATPLPVVWSEQIPEVVEIALPAGVEAEIAWSPTTNQIAYTFCPDPMYKEAIAKGLWLASSPQFKPQELMPTGFTCSLDIFSGSATSPGTYWIGIYWHPNGQELFYLQPSYPEMNNAETYIWRLPLRPDAVAENLQVGGWRIDGDFYWLSDTVFSFWHYNGGPMFTVYDLEQKEVVIWYGRGVTSEINEQRDIILGVQEATSETDNLWFAFDSFSGTGVYAKSLTTSAWQPFPNLPNVLSSVSYGWLSANSNQLLVITSNHPLLPNSAIQEYFPGEQTIWDLQVWDVDTDEVTLLMPNIGSGVRFSADKQFLSRVTPENELQLLRFPSFEVLFSQTVAVDSQIERPLFIQNGRYFTFEQVNTITSGRELFIYDLTQQKMVQHLPNLRQAVNWNEDKTQFLYQTTDGELFWSAGVNGPTTLLSTEPLELTPYPLWSPAGDKVLYQIDQEWFMATPTGFYPLTVSGGQQLNWPEWSFDGSYLSFRYRTGLLIVSLNRPEGE